MNKEAIKTLVKTLIFTVVVPGTVTVLIPSSLLPSGVELHWRGFRLFGVAMIAVGAGFYLRCALDFAFTGRGTPAPIHATRKLVTRGLYNTVRNPMYVGVLLILLGEAMLFRSRAILGYAALVGLLFHAFVVLYEEPTLNRKFGAAYHAYCQAVPRWIPRLAGTKKE